MDKIDSFKINHHELLPCIYVSRKDNVGGETVTTFDIRLKSPNVEEALTPESSHTIEHLAATFLRNDEEWKERIIYFGPMGCLTGFYLIVNGDYKPWDIWELMERTFRFISDFEGDIPGATSYECGNYKLHNLETAKIEAKKYLRVLT